MAATIAQVASNVSPTTDGGTNSTTNTATWTNTRTSGSLLIASLVTGVTTITPPTGWTELTAVDGTFSGNLSLWVGYRYWQGGDSTSVTFTLASALPSALVMREITGAVASNPLDVALAAGNTTAQPLTATTGSGTAAAAGELVLLDAWANIGSHTETTVTPPANFATDAQVGATDWATVGTTNFSSHYTLATGTVINAATVSITNPNFGNGSIVVCQYLIKSAAGSVHTANVSDTGATISDALSMAQQPAGVAPDRATNFADTPAISVQVAGGGTFRIFIPRFRRANWI